MQRQAKINDGCRTGKDKPVLVRVGDREWWVGGESTEPVPVPTLSKGESLGTVFHLPGRNDVPCQGPEPTRRLWGRWSRRLGGWLNLQVARVCDVLRPLAGTDAMRTATGFRPRGVMRRLRDSFQTGLILGLALGCLSLLWFHQLEPWRSDGVPVASGGMVAEAPGGVLSVPGFDVQALVLKRFPDDAAVPSEYRGGVNGVALWTLPSGQVLAVSQAAITTEPLDKQVRAVRAGQVMAVHLPVRELPVRVSASVDTASVSRWLFAEAAALRALTAVVMQGTAAEDATQAYANAVKLRPSAQVLSRTGYGEELQAFAADVDDAYTTWEQGKADAARTAIVRAYGSWLALAMTGGGISAQ